MGTGNSGLRRRDFVRSGVGNGRIPRFVRPERKREAQTHSLYGSMFQSSLLLSAARQNSNSRRGLCEQTHICWKTRWRDPWKMAWTPTLLRVVAGDHATWDCKSLRWNPACRGFGRPDYCLAPSSYVRLCYSTGGVSGIFRPQKTSLHAPGDSVER